jgi:hypothetical protein
LGIAVSQSVANKQRFLPNQIKQSPLSQNAIMSTPHGTKGEADRLGFIEAERINAILEDTTEKLAFLDRYGDGEV